MPAGGSLGGHLPAAEKGRFEDEQHGITAETVPDGSGADKHLTV
ncbi:hypothetical protein [Streptomyces sp. CRN 30]|nr:hypothetical protein [Streptomyces sp. CRN 30]